MQNTNRDYLNWFFTLLVALFPALVLTGALFLFYLLVNVVFLKIRITKNSILKKRIYTILAAMFSVLALLVCLKWEYWSSINMVIPFLIIGFLFNRKAKINKENSMCTNSISVILMVVILIVVISVLFR